MKIPFIVFVMTLVACNAPNQSATTTLSSPTVPTQTRESRVEKINSTATPSATVTGIATSTASSSATPSATATLSTTTTLASSTSIPTAITIDPQQECASLASSVKPGLYVLSIQPVPELVWDNEPRLFDVKICNTLGVATLNSLRFVVRVFYPTEVRPVGQTTEVTAQLAPGLNALKFESWTPGLRNHITACQQQPPVQVEVDYIVPPDLSALRVMPFADGTNRRTFGVKCGGTFP